MKKERSIGLLIHKIENRMKARIDNQFKEHDLTFSQSQILFQLKAHEGVLSQKQLQDLLKVSHPTMVGLIKRLEVKGFVKTSLDEKDRRNKIISATSLSKRFYEDMEVSRKENNDRMLKGLDAKKQEELLALLEKVYANLEEGR